MKDRSHIIRSTGSFQIKDGKLLLIRLGPVNGRRQLHNYRSIDMVTLQPKEWDAETRGKYSAYARRTPERRGYWAFPFPFHDAFFYYHVWKRMLPKRLQTFDWSSNTTDLEQQEFLTAYDAKLRAIRKQYSAKLIWHAGPFYSHIRPCGMVGERTWWRYDNVREFVTSARKQIWAYYRSDTEVFRVNYSKDHLELFVPD